MAAVDGGAGPNRQEGVRALGLFVFGLDGTVLATKAYDGVVPIRADQVGGLLALTGSFRGAGRARPTVGATSRIRFDAFDVVSVRGSRGVVAAAYRASPTEAPAHEVHRVLSTLEKRWPYGSADGRRAGRAADRVAKRFPQARRGPKGSSFRGATTFASVFGIFSRSAR